MRGRKREKKRERENKAHIDCFLVAIAVFTLC